MAWSITVGTIAGTADAHPSDFPAVPALDRHRPGSAGRRKRGDRRRRVHGFAVPLRGPARIRPHPRRPPLRHPDAGGDALRRSAAWRASRAPGEAGAGTGRRAGRPRGEHRHRRRPLTSCSAPRSIRRTSPRWTNRASTCSPRLAEANLFLAIFNMVPAFPMDGGTRAARLPGDAARPSPRDAHRGRHRPGPGARAGLPRAFSATPS